MAAPGVCQLPGPRPGRCGVDEPVASARTVQQGLASTARSPPRSARHGVPGVGQLPRAPASPELSPRQRRRCGALSAVTGLHPRSPGRPRSRTDGWKNQGLRCVKPSWSPVSVPRVTRDWTWPCAAARPWPRPRPWGPRTEVTLGAFTGRAVHPHQGQRGDSPGGQAAGWGGARVLTAPRRTRRILPGGSPGPLEPPSPRRPCVLAPFDTSLVEGCRTRAPSFTGPRCLDVRPW